MLPPLRFEPILKPRAWGGGRLPLGADPTRLAVAAQPSSNPIGESWEIADLDDAPRGDATSIVAEGPLAGWSLHELRLAHGDELLGIASRGARGAFPLLVKYLDARENLSVQVHPSPAYARAHPKAHLKTEAWVVVDAAPHARVYRGLRASTTPEEFSRALATGTVLDHLEVFEVARGDCVYLPSGTCHALGAGLLVAEVQTPSDTTFRVWDWNRDDPSRPLHLDEARASILFGGAQSDGVKGVVRATDAEALSAAGVTTRLLCRAPAFRLEWMETAEGAAISIEATGVPEVWMTLDGAVRWRTASGELLANRGATVLRPAAVEAGEVVLAPETTVLRAFCPSPLDRAT
jgi:mannose-6-phosphate isomerase